MSGGVDSSVTAALLKERGFDVVGIHMKMWSDPKIPCSTKEERYDAMRVAAKLNIPFETWDFTGEYKKEVVDYMIREYAAGRTPNPDVMCNRHIKFGVFLQKALERGADFMATGHYVKIQKSKFAPSANSRASPVESQNIGFRLKNQNYSSKFKIIYQLFQAEDKNKDQSYFLWTLTQEQLKHCLFPIGEYTKQEVREMARKFNLPTAEKPDSQGVCFIGEFDMKDFLQRYIPQTHGKILTTAGKTIGGHEGLHFFTIGQRHGLGIGGGIPYYAVEKDFSSNTLTVAEGPYDEKLFSSELIVAGINWIFGQVPKLPLRCKTLIRYRQPPQQAVIQAVIETESARHEAEKKEKEVFVGRDSKFVIRFAKPQRAVTPGQSVVFYVGEEMLGGGVIQ